MFDSGKGCQLRMDKTFSDYQLYLTKMVDDISKGTGIKNSRLLDALRRVPRHLFVEEALGHRAYGDYSLPIGSKQTISNPITVALMTNALSVSGSEYVLEIGTGSGYQTAILCELSERVYTVERLSKLAATAIKRLEGLGYKNFLPKTFDGTYGWNEYAPFDRIMVTACAPSIPETLLSQLSDNGIMVIPVGNEERQELIKVEKLKSKVKKKVISDCHFVKLLGTHGWPV
ncbi:MAG: protein-L-isoaspartate(D-aspartate) O-methyltransferase [Nitrospinota bacterium]